MRATVLPTRWIRTACAQPPPTPRVGDRSSRRPGRRSGRLAPDLPDDEGDGVVLHVYDAFLQRDDPVVRDDGEGAHRGNGDGFARLEDAHACHAGQSRTSVDFGRARSALAGLAVPPDGQIAGLCRLDPVQDVEDDFAVLVWNVEVLELS